MTLLSREAIFAAIDLKHEDVEVPEWGGTVRVRMMTGAERDAFSAAMVDEDGKPRLTDYTARLVAATVVGDDGERVFTADDVEALGRKSAIALARVFAVADRINKLGAEAVEAAAGN